VRIILHLSMGTTRKSAIETKINNRYISNRGWSQKVILQNLFLTVIKTTGTNEEKVFYSWGTSTTCKLLHGRNFIPY